MIPGIFIAWIEIEDRGEFITEQVKVTRCEDEAWEAIAQSQKVIKTFKPSRCYSCIDAGVKHYDATGTFLGDQEKEGGLICN